LTPDYHLKKWVIIKRTFYKDSLGLSDVGELAALMSGDMDLVAGATQDSAPIND
jgi:hypothetical protein